MSRNFELLRKVHKERATEICVAGLSVPVRAVPEEQAVSNELRKFVQRVFLLPPPELVPHLVLFSSVDGNTENNRICGQVAQVLGRQVPGSICILDAKVDPLSGSEYLNVDSEYELPMSLDDPGHIRDLAVPLPGNDLWLLPGRNGKSNKGMVTSLLRSREHELRASFDYVLVDGPPMDRSDDALRLGQLVDGMVLIVEANSTRRDTARRVQDNLQAANVKLFGVVMTDRTYPIPEALYRLL